MTCQKCHGTGLDPRCPLNACDRCGGRGTHRAPRQPRRKRTTTRPDYLHYRGYQIAQDLGGRWWYVSRGGRHVATEESLWAAQVVIDGLVGGPDPGPAGEVRVDRRELGTRATCIACRRASVPDYTLPRTCPLCGGRQWELVPA